MKFSLIQVTTETEKGVSGSWIQDHIGNIESAVKRAREVENANCNLITVCVVLNVDGTTPALGYFQDLKKLS